MTFADELAIALRIGEETKQAHQTQGSVNPRGSKFINKKTGSFIMNFPTNKVETLDDRIVHYVDDAFPFGDGAF